MHLKITNLRTSSQSQVPLSGKLYLRTRNSDLFLELRKNEVFLILIRLGVFLTPSVDFPLITQKW